MKNLILNKYKFNSKYEYMNEQIKNLRINYKILDINHSKLMYLRDLIYYEENNLVFNSFDSLDIYFLCQNKYFTNFQKKIIKDMIIFHVDHDINRKKNDQTNFICNDKNKICVCISNLIIDGWTKNFNENKKKITWLSYRWKW